MNDLLRESEGRAPDTNVYEWPFEMLRAAAIRSLEILQVSLNKGFILKDATPYNIQFMGPNPLLIADLLLGRLIDKVKKKGIYDNSVIIVTSDHGLRDPMVLGAKPIDVTDRIAQVPLVIHAPGLDNGISDVDYQHIDFAPTLNDLLGLPPPEGTQGMSAFSQERPQRDKVFHNAQWTYTYSPEDGSWRSSQEE